MPNRTMCSILEEMRKLNETRNFSSLLGLIEELQSMANSMEAALSDQRDMKYYREKRSELRKETAKLKEEWEQLKLKIEANGGTVKELDLKSHYSYD